MSAEDATREIDAPSEWPHFFEDDGENPNRCFHDDELWPCWAERVRVERDAAIRRADRLAELAEDAVRGAAQVGMFFPALEAELGLEDGLTRSIAETTAKAVLRGEDAFGPWEHTVTNHLAAALRSQESQKPPETEDRP